MIADEREFWSRVHEHLDERRDPLADPAILESVLAHAGRREALLSMLGALDPRQLAAAATLPARPARAPFARRVAAALGIVALAALAWLGATRRVPTPPSPPEARAFVQSFADGATCVVSWTLTVTCRKGEATSRDSIGSQGAALSDVGASRRDSDCATVAFLRSARLP